MKQERQELGYIRFARYIKLKECERRPSATSSPWGGWVQAHEARQFTDVASFTLRCGVCQIGVRGEREAVEHAKATGHSNFSEYH